MGRRRPAWIELRKQGVSADNLLVMYGMEEPPINVHRLAEKLGVSVFEKQTNTAGQLQIDSEKQRAYIYVNPTDSRVRQRFTMAHEIGHLMLHRGQTQFRETEIPGDRQEIEANQYAANLLVPLWMLSAEAPHFDFEIPPLARKFQVSKQAMKFRIELLLGYRRVG